MHAKSRRVIMALCLGLSCTTAFAQSKQVTGTVKDNTGEPLMGVTVMVNGKPAAVTDLDGNFTIKDAAPGAKLSISYIGYKNQTITLGNQSNLDVVMADDNQNLNEVVVVGYGTMKKSDLTGSIASVHAEDLVAKGSSSVLGAMQGQVPGVNITQSTGRANGGLSIAIRGNSSINSSTTPMFIVDGVICDNIDFLNEQDIERIDILKDASSLAIYGSRATAGVVIVTTKGGMKGEHAAVPSISYDGYYGISKAVRMPDFQNARQFYDYRFKKFLTYAGTGKTNGTPGYQLGQGAYGQGMILMDSTNPFGAALLKERLAQGVDVDWPDMVTQNGHQQNHYLSVAGSAKGLNYNVGLGYHGVDGIYKGDQNQKISFKGGLNADINKYVTAGFNMNIAKINNKYASDNGVAEAYRMNPFMQPYDEEGNLILKPGNKDYLGTNNYQFTDSYNPLAYFDNEEHRRETWRLLGNFYVDIKPMKGLDFQSTFSPNFSYYRDGTYEGTLVGEDTNSATRSTSRSFHYSWENRLTYDNTFNKIHHLNVMGMVSAEKATTEKEVLAYTGVLNGTTWHNLGTGTYNADASKPSNYTEWRMLSYALRANYTLMDRYMLTATMRWDGSSRFRSGRKWGSFPSVALAWRISEENFIKNKAPWISNLKLRLSYGETGNNSGIKDFAYAVSVAGPNYYPFGPTTFNAMYPSGIVDPDISWEKSHETNLGLDFGFLDGRISGTLDLYSKKSTDLLFDVPLPLEVGNDVTMTTNVGSVQNRGIELSLTGVILQTKDWNWTVTANYSHNSSHIKEIDGTGSNILTGDVTGNLIMGASLSALYGYQWDGIVTDKTMTVPNTEIAQLKGFTPGSTVKQSDYYYACYGLTEGNPIVKDVNGDGKFTNDDKKVFRGDPSWIGSISTNVSYKGFDFAASLYTKQHFWVYSPFYERYCDLGDRGRQRLNMDFYIPAGTLIDCDGVNNDGTYINPVYQQSTHYGKYPFPNNGGTSGGTNNSYWAGENGATNIEKISWTKIKNITLGYTLPKSITQKFGCQRLRLYVTVTDPFVITGYKGFDPEWAGTSLKNDGPSTTTWQFGANIKF